MLGSRAPSRAPPNVAGRVTYRWDFLALITIFSSLHAEPFLFGVVADMRRVAQLLGLFVALARKKGVFDHDEPVRNPLHLGNGRGEILEMVRRDPGDDDVEAPVGEGQLLPAGDD